jgi:anti-anti-sigma regulatory factor
MSLALELRDGVTHARLEGELTVFAIEGLQDDVLGLLNHERVTLDLSELTDLDGCGAQLLAIVQMQALRAGKSIYGFCQGQESHPLLLQIGQHGDQVRQ